MECVCVCEREKERERERERERGRESVCVRERECVRHPQDCSAIGSYITRGLEVGRLPGRMFMRLGSVSHIDILRSNGGRVQDAISILHQHHKLILIERYFPKSFFLFSF